MTAVKPFSQLLSQIDPRAADHMPLHQVLPNNGPTVGDFRALMAHVAAPQAVAPTEEIAGLVTALLNDDTTMDFPEWCRESRELRDRAAAALTASEAEATSLRTERDNALEELGRVIMACPPGMRTSPASEGVKALRRKLEEHRRALEEIAKSGTVAGMHEQDRAPRLQDIAARALSKEGDTDG